MNAPRHVKEFKFNPKTYQFTFNRALPKVPSEPGHFKFVEKGPFFDYSQAGRTMEVIIKETKTDLNYLTDLLFRSYNYKDSFQNQKNRILVEEALIKDLTFLRPLEFLKPIEGLPHFISHQNLFYCRIPGSSSINSLITKNPNQDHFPKNFMQLSGQPPSRKSSRYRHEFGSQAKVRIKFHYSSEVFKPKLHLATLSSASDHIRVLFDFKEEASILEANFINLRNKKCMKKIQVPALEILDKLGYLDKKIPSLIQILSAEYVKELDTLLLNFRYQYKKEPPQDDLMRMMPQTHVSSLVLIQNFSNSVLRKAVRLKVSKSRVKDVSEGISRLQDGTYSVCCYVKGVISQGIDLYFLGGKKTGSIEHFDLSWLGIDFHHSECLKVLKRDGDIYLVASEVKFLCLDLQKKLILSSIQFGGELLPKTLYGISNHQETRDLVFSVGSNVGQSMSKNSIQVVEVTKKSIQAIKEIDLTKWLLRDSVVLQGLIGIKEIDSPGIFLLLAKVRYVGEQRDQIITQKELAQIEVSLHNADEVKVSMIEDR